MPACTRRVPARIVAMVRDPFALAAIENATLIAPARERLPCLLSMAAAQTQAHCVQRVDLQALLLQQRASFRSKLCVERSDRTPPAPEGQVLAQARVQLFCMWARPQSCRMPQHAGVLDIIRCVLYTIELALHQMAQPRRLDSILVQSLAGRPSWRRSGAEI